MKKYDVGQSVKENAQLSQLLPGGNHSSYGKEKSSLKIHFKKGKKSRCWDVDGNEYLDLYAKSGCLLLGHNHPKYIRSLKRALELYPNTDIKHNELNILRKLKENIPCCEMVFFGLSGTETIQNAFRLARAYTGKNRILTFEGHFHGTSDNILGGKAKSLSSPIAVDDVNSIFSTKGRAAHVLEEQKLIIPWNDITRFAKIISDYSHEIAAVIMEPYCINGGGISPDLNYLSQVVSLCHKNNIIVIFDEVITGLRLGLGGAQKKLGITPDLAILGKSLGGGLPISALVGKKDIMKLYAQEQIVYGGTNNGYALGLAAINSMFDILRDKRLYENINRRAKQIYQILKEQSAQSGINLVIQGPLACSSYHVSEEEITSTGLMTESIVFKNGVVRECLQQYGILTAHTSRMYMNTSLNDSDIVFFRNRVGYALYDASMIINRIKDRKVKHI